jgi:integrase
MATVQKRTWLSRGPTGHKVRKVAYGYTLQVNGKQERKFSAEWTREAAQDALAARLLERDTPPAPAAPKTFAQVCEEYLAFKRGKGKRSVREDEKILTKLKARLGADTPLPEITAQRIAHYDRDRVSEISTRGRHVTPSTVNRELAVLRHLLRLAEEWGYVEKVPRIRMAPEPQGRLRFLSEEELVRLLAACEAKASKSPVLLPIVTVAVNTGMRKGEILGLAWERVDFARGMLRLEQTKSGRRREIPMNQAVDEALSRLAGPKAEGLVFRKRDGSEWGSIRTAFEGALREAKIEAFRFHDLRHTFASHFMMSTGDLPALQKILGHATLAMTMRYAHLAEGHVRQAINALRFSTKSAHGDRIGGECSVTMHAPVAQVDRATVS